MSVINWQEFKSPTVLAKWLAGAAVVIGIFCALVYAVLHTMPQLANQQDALAKQQAETQKLVMALPENIQGRLDRMSDSQQRQMDALATDNKAQFAALNLSITGLKNNVMDLCLAAKATPKGCNFHALIAQAKSATAIQAQFVELNTLKLLEGVAAPQVTSEKVKDALPAVSWGEAGVTTYYGEGTRPGNATKPNTADALMWFSAADKAKWTQKGDHVKVNFANGEADFKIRRDAQGRAVELVKSLNGTAEAMQTLVYAKGE